MIGETLKLKIGKMIPGKKMIDNLLPLASSALLVAFVSLDASVSLDGFAFLDGFVSLGSFASLDSFVPLGNALLLSPVSHAVNAHCCKVFEKKLSGFFFLPNLLKTHHFKLHDDVHFHPVIIHPLRYNVYNPYL